MDGSYNIGARTRPEKKVLYPIMMERVEGSSALSVRYTLFLKPVFESTARRAAELIRLNSTDPSPSVSAELTALFRTKLTAPYIRVVREGCQAALTAENIFHSKVIERGELRGWRRA